MMKYIAKLFFKIFMLLKLFLLSNIACSQINSFPAIFEAKYVTNTVNNLQNGFDLDPDHKLFELQEKNNDKEVFIETCSSPKNASLNSFDYDYASLFGSIIFLRGNTEENSKRKYGSILGISLLKDEYNLPFKHS